MEQRPNNVHLNIETLERLSAFYLYKSHGLEIACSVYPGQRNFIMDHMGQSLDEVRKEAYREQDTNNHTYLL